MQWDKDFDDFVADNDFYFSCYNRECDEEAMDCDPLTGFIGCPSQVSSTCKDASDGIMTDLLLTWSQLVATSGRSECEDKGNIQI